jgi:uncharacterized protein YcbK (DUF882 family)
VTPNFKSSEFDRPERTVKGVKHAHAAYPNAWHKARLLPLCQTLEVIRAELGKPIRITSGYRDPAYNRAIGGARASQHMEGRAADIVVKGVPAKKVHDTVLRLYQEGKLPHLRGLGAYNSFTHVDVRPATRLVRWKGSRVS